MKKYSRSIGFSFAACWILVSCGGGPAPTPTPASELTVNTTGDEGQGLCNHPA